MFHFGLTIFGTDFSSISNLIEFKTRSQVANKYQKEQKINQTRIDNLLNKHESCEELLKNNLKDLLSIETREENCSIDSEQFERFELKNILNKESLKGWKV